MIELNRSLARQLRAIFRKSVPAGTPRGLNPRLTLEAGRQGLRVRMQLAEVGVEYRASGSHAADAVMLPLGQVGAVPPGDDYLRIASSGPVPMSSPPSEERRIIPMPPPSNGPRKGPPDPPPASPESSKNPPGVQTLMEEAAELKSLLRDAYVRVGRLLEGLKAQRQQSRLLRSTLSSLKQLQRFDG